MALRYEMVIMSSAECNVRTARLETTSNYRGDMTDGQASKLSCRRFDVIDSDRAHIRMLSTILPSDSCKMQNAKCKMQKSAFCAIGSGSCKQERQGFPALSLHFADVQNARNLDPRAAPKDTVSWGEAIGLPGFQPH
jgi:hypothetical protein